MKASEAFKTIEVGKNQTSIPRLNPGRFKLAIKGAPTFVVKGKEQETPCLGVYWLVSIQVLAIVSDSQERQL